MIQLSFFKFTDTDVIEVKNDLPLAEWEKNVNWVNINADDRKEVIDYLTFFNFSDEINNLILNPGDHLLTETSHESIIQNFIISKKSSIFERDYITLVLLKNLTICILPASMPFSLEINEPEVLMKQYKNFRIYFTYLLVRLILTQSTMNVSNTRKQIHNLELNLISSPEKVSSADMMSAVTNIRYLADIVEDQYIGFNFFNKLIINKNREPDAHKLKEVIDSFRELSRISERLEEKAESLRTQFMLIHQEESARKINILTIVQAIFVPLTFLAGIYGMNFSYMPELNWKYAYFVVWGIFVLLSSVLLYFFKKNRWFD